jgi:hypothetical protein
LPDNLIGDPEATFGNGILKLTWNIKQTPPKDENRKVIAVKNNDADLPKCERQAEGKEPFDKSGILRYEIFTSAPINYNPKHKLTNEKIYPILCEASDDTRILYTTIDDCGNTIVVDAANFQAITEESLARHKSGVGKSEKWCEEVRKSINESVSHIGFNGKHTTYRLGYKNINPSSIKGSVYVDDDVICLFTVNDSNALILAPSRDQDEFYILRGNADIDNSTIHLDWNIVPPQTNVVVSYEYQMNIFGAKRSTEYASKIDKKFSSNGDIVFSIKDDKSLSESEDIKVSRELSMEETWRALAGVNGVELDLVKQKAV